MERRGLAASVLFLLPFLILSRQGPLEAALPVYWACLGAAFLAYWYAWVEGKALLTATQTLLLGLAARLALLPLPPSDDIYRYLWEGKVLRHGFSPYRCAPDHPYLAFLRNAEWAHINHPHLPTLYPPVAQAFFWIAAAIAPTFLVFKLAVLACDTGAFFALKGVLQRRRDEGAECDAQILGLYFLNPLLIFEGAGRAHFDPLVAWLNVAFLAALGLRRAPFLLGLGGLAKVSSLVLAPLLLFRKDWKRGLFECAAVGACVAAALWYVGAIDVLRRFATHFRFNGAAASLVEYGLPFLSASARRAVLGALFAATLAGCLWRARNRRPESLALACLGPMLLFSPTLHPWYLIWILPFAALARSRPWLLLSASCLISYEVYARMAATGAWSEREWLRLPEYLPPLLLWAWTEWRRGKTDRDGNADATVQRELAGASGPRTGSA